MNPLSDDGPLHESHSAGAVVSRAQAKRGARDAVSQEEAQCSRSEG